MNGLQTALFCGAAALSGCTTPPHCDALGKCGGDFTSLEMDLGSGAPSQEWVATAKDACIDNVPTPVDPPTLALLPPRPAGVRPVEPSTADWCGGLVLSSDGQGGFKVAGFDDGWVEALKRYNGWFPSIPLWTAQLEVMRTPSQYALQTTQLASQRIELSANCVTAQGIRLKCEDLNTLLYTAVNEKLNGKQAGNNKGTPLVSGLSAVVYGNSCTDNAEGGCTCQYNLSLTTTQSGPWSADNSGHLSFFDSSAAPVTQTDYCAKGDTLEISGSKETDLFNRGALKTMTFHQPSCTDGVLSKTLGETRILDAATGASCGGKCGACPK